ncbi:hypothetical protein VTO73DRAFT_12402 [Trametes versicolor]
MLFEPHRPHSLFLRRIWIPPSVEYHPYPPRVMSTRNRSLLGLLPSARTEPTYDPTSWDVPFNLTVGAYVEEDTDENQTALKNSQCIFVVTDKSPIFIGIVHTAPDDPAAPHIFMRSPILDVGSKRALALAKEHVDECVHKHKRCIALSVSPDPLLPTRLIDCTDLNHPRLVSTSGCRGRYVTLSYVWGGDQLHKTTLSNISAYTCGIDPSLLPATIHDAIYVTHTLGFQYLWVDSLCIIQDSGEDKLHEIGRMHHTYRYAHLTIIAASAQKVSEGFLQDRQPPPQMDLNDPLSGGDITVPFICPPPPVAPECAGMTVLPKVGTIHITPHHSHTEHVGSPHAWLYSGDLGPVTTRAWCMQEYLMSPRVLIFTSRTLQFRCQTTTQSNVRNSLCEILQERRMPDALLRPGPPAALACPGSAEWAEIHGVWQQIAEEYSRRMATVPSDKLVACAAVAQQFHSVLGSDYLAGLWRHSLLLDLLWSKDPFTWMHRPEGYRAPSWSWAAVDGQFICHRVTPPSKASLVEIAKVERCEVALEDATVPFGRVTGGSLVLCAPFIRCSMLPNHSPEHREIALQSVQQARHEQGVGGSSHPADTVAEVDGPLLSGTAAFDCEADAGTEETWAVPILLDGSSTTGLVVTRADLATGLGAGRGKVSYRRVGWFSVSFMDWLENEGDAQKAAREVIRALKAEEYPSVSLELV